MAPPARNPGRTLALLCLASSGWAFSFGLGAPLAALWLRDAGCSRTAIGLNTSVYYLGVAAAAAFVPRLMRRRARACVVAGMVTDALTTALFPWVGSPAGWFLLRGLGGAGTALSLVPMETLVNHNAPPDRRARDFGVYAVSVALGVGLGPVLGLPLYPVAPRLTFAAGGLVTLLAAGLAARALPRAELPAEEAGRDSLAPGEHLLGFGTAWAQGFLEGAVLTFLSVYLLALGYTGAGASGLTAALFLGVVLFQVPVAWLADRAGRLRVLLACHAAVLAGLAVLPFAAGPGVLGAGLFVVGGCAAALYPLGLALLGERLPPGALGKANAWYLACNCAGSLSGPVLTGLAMDALGSRGLFGAGAAAVALVLAVGGGRHLLLRGSQGNPPSGAAGNRAA
jgi:MFS family permease